MDLIKGGTDLSGFPERLVSDAAADQTGLPINTTNALYTDTFPAQQ